jgi:hypothetical protein
MSRIAQHPFVTGVILLPVLALACARHQGEMSGLGAFPRQSDCEVDIRNPSAEGMQVWAHVIDGRPSTDPVTLLLGTFSRGESTTVPEPAGYRYSHFSTFGTMTARGGQPTAIEHCFERRP